MIAASCVVATIDCPLWPNFGPIGDLNCPPIIEANSDKKNTSLQILPLPLSLSSSKFDHAPGRPWTRASKNYARLRMVCVITRNLKNQRVTTLLVFCPWVWAHDYERRFPYAKSNFSWFDAASTKELTLNCIQIDILHNCPIKATHRHVKQWRTYLQKNSARIACPKFGARTPSRRLFFVKHYGVWDIGTGLKTNFPESQTWFTHPWKSWFLLTDAFGINAQNITSHLKPVPSSGKKRSMRMPKEMKRTIRCYHSKVGLWYESGSTK